MYLKFRNQQERNIKKTRDLEKLLGNMKFLIIMIIIFLIIGINLSAAENSYTEKRYFQKVSQKLEKNENKETGKKYSEIIRKQIELKKNFEKNFDNLEIYCRNLNDQSFLTDEEWDNVKNIILSKADEINQKDKFSF